MIWDLLERTVRAVRTRAPGDVLELVNAALEDGRELVARMLDGTPVAVLALVVALLAWRRGGVIAGVLSGLALGLLGWSGLWPAVVDSLAVGLVGAVLGGLVAAPLVWLVRRAGGRSRASRPVRLPAAAVPALTIVGALAVPVLVEVLASDLTPGRLLAVGVAVACFATVALVRAPGRPGPGDWAVALVMTGVAVSLVVGTVDGHGLGGALHRALTAHDVIAIGQAAVCVALVLVLGLALAARRGRPAPAAEGEVEGDVSSADEARASGLSADPNGPAHHRASELAGAPAGGERS